ncbi:protein BCL9 [Sarcoptes scabiei]|nr:protein BCL9 [Sarcoptes scabiei]
MDEKKEMFSKIFTQFSRFQTIKHSKPAQSIAMMMFARLVTCASRKVLLKYPYKTLQAFKVFFSNQKSKPINILIITIIIVLIKTSQQKRFNELKSIQMKENKSKY